MFKGMVIEKREYEGRWVIDDEHVNPPCAYTSVEDWFTHLYTKFAPYRAIISHLRTTPQTSTAYEHLAQHAYYKILDHLDKNYARR